MQFASLQVVDGDRCVKGRSVDAGALDDAQCGIDDGATIGEDAVVAGAGAISSNLPACIDAIPVYLEADAVVACFDGCDERGALECVACASGESLPGRVDARVFVVEVARVEAEAHDVGTALVGLSVDEGELLVAIEVNVYVAIHPAAIDGEGGCEGAACGAGEQACLIGRFVDVGFGNAEVEGLCEAVLGTHIIRKMGEIRFEREKSCFVLPAEESVAPKQRNIFFDSNYYIWCRDGGERVVMHFDTGNNKTYLSSRYYNRFTERVEQEGSDVERSRSGGFGGVEWCDIRTLPKVEFDVCGQALQVEKVAVTMPIKYEDGTPYIEPYDGVVGVDFLTAREVVTFDLSRMFFRVDK